MTYLSRCWLVVAATVGGLGVMLGAFGAHGLSARLTAMGYADDELIRRLGTFDTAARYQLLHALALCLTAILLDRADHSSWRLAAWSFLTGVIVFSGLLYVLTFAGEDWRWLGRIVPLGGLAMILGWGLLALGAWRS